MTSSSSSSSSTMLKTLLPFCESVQCNDLHSTEKPCICIDIKSSPATTSHDYHYIGYPVDPTITTTTTTEVSLQNLSAAPASFVVSRQSPQPQHDISLNRSAAASSSASSSSAAEKENNDNMQIFNNGMNVAATTSSSVAGGDFLPAASTTHVASVTVHNNQQQAISHPQNQPSMHHHHHNNHQQHPSIDDNNAIDILSPSYPCSCGRPVEKDSNIVSGDEDNVITAQRKGHHL